MTINCVIIDDELNNISNLETILLEYCDDLCIVGVAQNAEEGIAIIRKHKPDLVFLDIQMPNKSGFEVLKFFPEPAFEVIFVTAFDQYGIQAIKFSALDYLLKPINIPELKLAVYKARQRLLSKKKDDKLDNLLAYIERGYKDVPKIALPTLYETRYIRLDEISRCEASDNYTTFYTETENLLVSKTLKDFAELLQPHGFVRTHQSHLVNINFVKSWLKEDGGVLLMKDANKIPISRQNRDLVKKALNEML